MSESVCGSIVSSRRGLLAFVWTGVTFLVFVAFVTALLFTIYAKDDLNDNYNEYYYYNNQQEGEGGSQDQQQQQEQQEDQAIEVAVTSRAMAFAALWTAVLATLTSVFGTVVLGFQSPTGEYYTCCDPQVHRTTPLGLGSFIGSLLMLANLTLVCSVLFGEFKIRDYNYEAEERKEEDEWRDENDTNVQRSSLAFSILCMFLTVVYAGFAALTYASATQVLKESKEDARGDSQSSSNRNVASGFHPNGYIDGRFDVIPATTTKQTTVASSFVPSSEGRQSQLLPSNDFVVGTQTPLSMTDTNSSTGFGETITPGYVEPNPLFENGNAATKSTYTNFGGDGGGTSDESSSRYEAPRPPPFNSGGEPTPNNPPNPFDAHGTTTII